MLKNVSLQIVNNVSEQSFVAFYAALHPAMSVRRSVVPYPFFFFSVFELFKHAAPAQMP